MRSLRHSALPSLDARRAFYCALRLRPSKLSFLSPPSRDCPPAEEDWETAEIKPIVPVKPAAKGKFDDEEEEEEDSPAKKHTVPESQPKASPNPILIAQ